MSNISAECVWLVLSQSMWFRSTNCNQNRYWQSNVAECVCVYVSKHINLDYKVSDEFKSVDGQNQSKNVLDALFACSMHCFVHSFIQIYVPSSTSGSYPQVTHNPKSFHFYFFDKVVCVRMFRPHNTYLQKKRYLFM